MPDDSYQAEGEPPHSTTQSNAKSDPAAPLEQDTPSNKDEGTERAQGDRPIDDQGHEHTEQDRNAALLIQRNYRGYRARRELEGLSISADSRWQDAITRLRLQQAHKQADSGKNDSTTRWKRGGLLVGQLTGAGDKRYDMADASVDGDEDDEGGAPEASGAHASGGQQRSDGPVEGGPSLGSDSDASSQVKVGDVPGGNDGDKVDNIRSIAHPKQRGLRAIERWTRSGEAQELSKVMEAQYWLEMVDTNHRYGSNLKYYHAAWMQAETKLNFFNWLDQGPGKELDLEDCPRERLDSEKVIYLSAEQRRNYIVDVRDGKLFWRRNDRLVDTAKGKHRDLGQGRGIVDLGPEEQKEAEQEIKRRALQRGVSEGSLDSVMGDGSSDSSLSSSDDEEYSSGDRRREARHYQSKRSGKSRHLDALSPSNWADMMLRKTIGSNTWIYVYNNRGEMYVGLKKTGYFQHSSFLYGGRVLSAGLLRVDQGQLTSLSPLSGHYRAGTAHFRYFVKTLQNSGVDLSRVTLSKSLLMLAGMEKYGALRSAVKSGGGGSNQKGEKGKKQQQQEGQQEKKKPSRLREKEGGEQAHEKDASLVDRVKAHLHLGHDRSSNRAEPAEATTTTTAQESSKREKVKDLLLPGHKKRKEERDRAGGQAEGVSSST